MPISTAQKATLTNNVLFLCTLWKITSSDGLVITACNHTRNVVYGADTYTPIPLKPEQVKTVAGLDTDDTSLTIVLTSAFSEVDLRAGRWRGARWEIFEGVNYLNPTDGYSKYRKGIIGEAVIRNGTATPEMFGLGHLLNQTLGAKTSRISRTVLGDAFCKVNLAGNTVDGTPITTLATIATVTSNKIFTVNIARPNDFYLQGWVEFTGGANSGRGLGSKQSIKTNTGVSIELVLAMSANVAVNDSLKLIAGCNRTREQCRDKFANIVSFRGEPDVPGLSKALTYPS